MDELLRRWGCTDPVAVAVTPTSRVYRVRTADGSSAIVKWLTPEGAREATGADYLAWRDGVGAVRTLARAPTAFLIEDAGSISLLSQLDALGDAGATAVLIAVLGDLHSPATTPAPATLPHLADWFASLFERAGRGSEALLVEAAEAARELLADQCDVKPLHGDLHHGNVYRSDRGWIAIDPKGLIGDAAYDVANVFCNPVDRDDLRNDPTRIRGIAAAFEERFDRDAATVLRWAFVHACLSASWHLDDGNAGKASRSLRVAAAIRSTLR